MPLPTWVLCNSKIIILYDILLPMMTNSLSFDKVQNSFIVEQHMFNIIPLFHQKKLYIYTHTYIIPLVTPKKKKKLIEMMSHSAIRCLVSVL